MLLNLLRCVSLLAILGSTSAAAQPELARAAFEEGMGLLGQNSFGEAVGAFERSLEFQETDAARYNLVLALRGSLQYLRASAELATLLRRELDPSVQHNAETLYEELTSRVARVTLPDAELEDEILVDGEVVAFSVDEALVLDPGSHRIERRRVGFEPQVQSVFLGAASEAALEFDDPVPLASRLRVVVEPDRALIRVDGHVRGQGGLDLELEPGTYAIEASAAGHRNREHAVTLTPGSQERLALNLERISVVRRWWFWSALAVVLAGAGTGIGLALRSNSTKTPNGSLNQVFTLDVGQ